MALTDGTSYHHPRPKQGDGKINEESAGVQSSLRDLLAFYKQLMIAAQEQTQDEVSSSLLKEIPKIFSPHIPLEPEKSLLKISYALT